MMMLIPEAWEGHETMSQAKKDFYAYHSCLMEPWDGPASIGFTDGKVIGAVLDRNGLRPRRYCVTKDGLVIMASEVGVLDVPPEDVVLKGRLEPGKMFLVDLEQGRIVDDEELKHTIASEQPVRQVAPRAHGPAVEDCPSGRRPRHLHHDDAARTGSRPSATPWRTSSTSSARWATTARRRIGSMGTDTPLAVLSDRPQPLFNYFKQLFAQVTNPPLDAIREELVTSVLTGHRAARATCSSPQPESCRQIALEIPFLDNDELARFKALDDWQRFKLDRRCRCSSPPPRAPRGWSRRSRRSSSAADEAIERGRERCIILSDRGVDARAGADPVAAGLRGPAPPPRPRGLADPGRPGHRVRRRPRGPPLRPAARLRRRGDQPVPRLRDARRHDRPGAHQAGIDHAEAV